MASIYRRGSIWWIKYYVAGKVVQKSLATDKRREALRLKTAIEHELAFGEQVPAENKNPIVQDFWSAYEAWAYTNKRRMTVETERAWWVKFIRFLNPTHLGDVTPADIERFKEFMLAEGLAKQSINNALRHIQTIYNYAIKLGHFTGKKTCDRDQAVQAGG